MGSIDVKYYDQGDKENYLKRVNYQPKINDAMAALRGYANSDLNSSVLSCCPE